MLPLNAGQGPALPQQTGQWQPWLDAKRRVAVLVGGDSRSHRLDPDDARRLARETSAWAKQLGARLLVVTSRRTAPALGALREGLTEDDLLYAWQPDDQTSNPYALALEHAEAVVVTGESESMLADVASRGRPLLIWPLQTRRPNPWQRLSARIADRATRPRYNRRGSVRPQQGLGYLCARLLERGLILPPRQTELLHGELIKSGRAARFGDALPAPADSLDELTPIVREVIGHLQLDAASRRDAPQTGGQSHVSSR